MLQSVRVTVCNVRGVVLPTDPLGGVRWDNDVDGLVMPEVMRVRLRPPIEEVRCRVIWVHDSGDFFNAVGSVFLVIHVIAGEL